jgi:hypothetical protein
MLLWMSVALWTGPPGRRLPLTPKAESAGVPHALARGEVTAIFLKWSACGARVSTGTGVKRISLCALQ